MGLDMGFMPVLVTNRFNCNTNYTVEKMREVFYGVVVFSLIMMILFGDKR